ncbi:hypothetical protein [Ekhidna sp.]
MMEWQSYKIEEIKTGSDESGNRLALQFCQDYKDLFGPDAHCCHTCPSFENKINKYIQKISTMKEVKNSGFELKPMYNGIQPKFGAAPVSNGNLTDEKAIELINEHPKGKDLFEKLPDNIDELMEGGDSGQTFDQQVNSLLKPQLVQVATALELETEGNVKELKARIIENGEVDLDELLAE